MSAFQKTGCELNPGINFKLHDCTAVSPPSSSPPSAVRAT